MSQHPCARCGIPLEAAGRRLLCNECRNAPRDRRERTERTLERLIAAEDAANPSCPTKRRRTDRSRATGSGAGATCAAQADGKDDDRAP